MRIQSQKEKNTRESDEVCAFHNKPIVAYEKEDGSIYCEKCVYEGRATEPLFMAVVANKLVKGFNTQHKEFIENCEELEEINARNVKAEMQEKVSTYFDMIRKKVDELETKVASKVEASENAKSLTETLEDMHGHMEAKGIHKKYEDTNELLTGKVGETRFTYICRRKEHFNGVITDIESDNQRLRSCIAKSKKLIDAILTIDNDEPKVENTLNEMAASMITIDEQTPDFGHMEIPEARDNPSSGFYNEI